MTNSQHDAGAGDPPRRRKRKRKGRRAEPAASEAPRPAPPPPASAARGLALGGALLLAAVLYTTTALGPDRSPHLLISLGALGFVFGSASGFDPRRVVLGAGACVAAGLAVVSTTTAMVGPALVMAGGLGLAGGIHKLGRMGPEEPAPEPSP